MQKIKRNERASVMMQMLCERPMHFFSLNVFCELFDAAKSTISEDLTLIKKILNEFKLGDLETVIGASGGVRYLPKMDREAMHAFSEGLAEKIGSPKRILPGGFLYFSDLLCEPETAEKIGRLFANLFLSRQPDFVITVETKGITVAMMTARALNCPLLIARRDHRVTEGSVVTINYFSASDKRIQTMSLARRSLSAGQKGIMIDDFMKGGGTVKGVKDLTAEFGAELAGVGVVMATDTPSKKMVEDYSAILTLKEVNPEKMEVSIEPAL